MDSDWRKEALAKFFNASFVHVDSEGDRMTLREQIAEKLFAEEMRLAMATGAHGDGPWSMPTYRDMAADIIAAFEEVLLSDEVVEAAQVAYDDAFTEHLMSTRSGWHATKAALQAAIAAAKGAEGSA